MVLSWDGVRSDLVARYLLVLTPALVACLPDDGPPSLDETGTGDTGTSDPVQLPGGPGCEANWYDIDGDAVPLTGGEPEAFDGSLSEPMASIDFLGPRPPARQYEERQIDPVFTELTFEQFAAQYATPFGNQWFVEGDQAMTDEGLHALYEHLHEAALNSTSTSPVPVSAFFSVDAYDSTWSSSEKLAMTWCLGRIMPSPFSDAEAHAERVDLALRTCAPDLIVFPRVAAKPIPKRYPLASSWTLTMSTVRPRSRLASRGFLARRPKHARTHCMNWDT